jgi:hypothetical protein
MDAFSIALLAVAVAAYCIQGRVAPLKLLISGIFFIFIGMGAAVFVVTLPSMRNLADAIAEPLAYGCTLVAFLGIARPFQRSQTSFEKVASSARLSRSDRPLSGQIPAKRPKPSITSNYNA